MSYLLHRKIIYNNAQPISDFSFEVKESKTKKTVLPAAQENNIQ